MNDKDIIKTINEIVWLIPNRKLRDSVRNLLTSMYGIKHNFEFQLDRITPKANIDFIEIHLAEHCNLNCQCCSHFSNLAEPEFTNIEVFERDIKRLSELSNDEVNIIHLMGGEPLLNPNCERFFELTRKYFNKTEIKLILLMKSIFKDSNWLSYTFFSGLLLLNALFKHPKYDFENINEDISNAMPLIRLRLVIGMMIFIIPCFMAALS